MQYHKFIPTTWAMRSRLYYSVGWVWSKVDSRWAHFPNIYCLQLLCVRQYENTNLGQTLRYHQHINENQACSWLSYVAQTSSWGSSDCPSWATVWWQCVTSKDEEMNCQPDSIPEKARRKAWHKQVVTYLNFLLTVHHSSVTAGL